MGNQDFGESSRETYNDDNSRPLKKAKYVWQVKGKYHLKATCQNKPEQVPDSSLDNTGHEKNHINKDEVCKNNCIDKFLAQTETIFESDDEDSVKNIDEAILKEIPITLVSSSLKNQDYYLHQWQARQIARSYIDNTINSVLETCITVPFDAENFVENCDNDGQVEDEGILMAIQSHGLQPLNPDVKDDSLLFVSPDEFASSNLSKLDKVQKNIVEKCLPDECVPFSGDQSETKPSVDAGFSVDILNTAILVAIEKKGLSSV